MLASIHRVLCSRLCCHAWANAVLSRAAAESQGKCCVVVSYCSQSEEVYSQCCVLICCCKTSVHHMHKAGLKCAAADIGLPTACINAGSHQEPCSGFIQQVIWRSLHFMIAARSSAQHISHADADGPREQHRSRNALCVYILHGLVQGCVSCNLYTESKSLCSIATHTLWTDATGPTMQSPAASVERVCAAMLHKVLLSVYER